MLSIQGAAGQVLMFAYFVFKQALPWQAILGLVLIVVGVVLVNTFSKA